MSMRYTIIETKMVKRTRYQILFDDKNYWISTINPKGIVKFIQPYRTLEAAKRYLDKIGIPE